MVARTEKGNLTEEKMIWLLSIPVSLAAAVYSFKLYLSC